jgi:hypothetical protein
MVPPADAQLVQAIAEDRAVAFLGSGLSVAAGLPDWARLLKELADDAFASELMGDADHADLIEWAGKPDFLMLADAIVNLLGRDRFIERMKTKFDNGAKPTDVHRALTAVPFAAYLTTNYDTLLEDAWSNSAAERLRVYTNADTAELRDPFRNRRPFLVKVHGSIDPLKALVLGLGEFRRATHENRAYRVFLQDVFRRYTVLFLGYSLSDPDVLNMLDELVAIFGEVPGRHFALVDAEKMSRLRAGVFDRNYGIQVIRYRKSAPNHPEVLEFVRSLAVRAAEEKRKQLASMVLQLTDDKSTTPLTEALTPFLKVDLVTAPNRAPQVVPVSAGPLTQFASTETAPSAGTGLPFSLPGTTPPHTHTLQEYCLETIGARAWKKLQDWYEHLGDTPAGELLRINLDRESQRDDFDGEIWADFLRELAEAGPSALHPFDTLTKVIGSGGSRFLLRGKKLETGEQLCRYVRLRHFVTLASAAAGNGGIESEVRESLMGIQAEDSNSLQIGEMLLGKPGGPSWCTTASFAAGRNAASIAADLWDGALAEPIVEIRYAADTLKGDGYLRIATVPDMYSGRVEEANILKPAAGQGGWCWTVRVNAASKWIPLAPAAVHPALRLSGANTRTLGLRVVM